MPRSRPAGAAGAPGAGHKENARPKTARTRHANPQDKHMPPPRDE